MDITREEIIKRFEEKGLTVVNPESYIKNTTKLTSYDKDGYYYYFSLNGLNKVKLNSKSRFSKNNVYLFQNIKLLLKYKNCQDEFVEIKAKTDGNNKGSKILVLKCNCGKTYNILLSKLTSDKGVLFGCEECKKEKFSSPKKYDYNFVKDVLYKNGYILIDEEYKGNNDNLNCINSDGYIVKVKFSYVINSYYNKNKSQYVFSYRFNKDNYLYNINNYFKINNINCVALEVKEDGRYSEVPTVFCKCKCGNIFYTNIYLIRNGKNRCNICNKYMSQIEYKVKEWLIENNIEFEEQKRFNNCKYKRPLPFDFYIPKLNICIEVDGKQHNKFFRYDKNSRESLKLRKKRDNIKTEFCKKNNIKLIRINYNQIERNHKEYLDILYNNLIKV